MIWREMIKNEWFKFARLYIFSNKVYLSLGFRHTVESGHEQVFGDDLKIVKGGEHTEKKWVKHYRWGHYACSFWISRKGQLNGNSFTDFVLQGSLFYLLCVITFFELANLDPEAVSSSYICWSEICNCPLWVKRWRVYDCKGLCSWVQWPVHCIASNIN